MNDEPSSAGTARLLGSYWLDSSYWHTQRPCCCFAPPPQRRVRGAYLARTALTVAAYVLVLTALALTAAG
ncbi:hypothetical protein ABZ079_35045 [Streptomyces sp. NPDC006314]|uniref:hypothetical protein n=1 Tax=Streptomyces sp. NPDC006314 TaxID=3154475 RepID=UPI0033AD2C7B